MLKQLVPFFVLCSADPITLLSFFKLQIGLTFHHLKAKSLRHFSYSCVPHLMSSFKFTSGLFSVLPPVLSFLSNLHLITYNCNQARNIKWLASIPSIHSQAVRFNSIIMQSNACICFILILIHWKGEMSTEVLKVIN